MGDEQKMGNFEELRDGVNALVDYAGEWAD